MDLRSQGPGRRTIDVAILAAALAGIWSQAALAYIDPGTGSAAYQVALTAILSVAYAIRRLMRGQGLSGLLGRVKRIFRSKASN
jgi:hypothetical protein